MPGFFILFPVGVLQPVPLVVLHGDIASQIACWLKTSRSFLWGGGVAFWPDKKRRQKPCVTYLTAPKGLSHPKISSGSISSSMWVCLKNTVVAWELTSHLFFSNPAGVSPKLWSNGPRLRHTTCRQSRGSAHWSGKSAWRLVEPPMVFDCKKIKTIGNTYPFYCSWYQ